MLVDNADFKVRTCFQHLINDISRRVPAGRALKAIMKEIKAKNTMCDFVTAV